MPESFNEAFPGGFDECVRTLGQEPSVDDPEDLCGWLQEHGFEALAEAKGDVSDVLLNLSVEYVSVVDEPAQRSEWLLAKSATAESEFNPEDDPLHSGEFVLKEEDEDDDEADDDPERKVWAAVLTPEPDAHDDMVPAPEIEKAAHEYLKHFRKVDEDHNLLDGSGEPIESYIVRDGPETFETPQGEEVTYPEGTWIMGVELTKSAWERVESGDLTGFSIYGGASSLDPDALLSEDAAKAIASYRSRKALEKQVPDDLLDALDAYFEDHGGDPSEVSIREFVEWALQVSEEVESVEVGGVEITASEDADGDEDDDEGGDEDDEEEQAKNEPAEPGADDDPTSNMGDESGDDGGDEQNDKLDRILSKVEDTGETLDEVQKSVSSVQERVEDLEEWKKSVTGDAETGDDGDDDGEGGAELDEEEVEEIAASAAEEAAGEAAAEGAEKALVKFLDLPEDELPDDPEERQEVVRKGVRSIGGHKDEDGDGISVSNGGIMEEV